MINYCDIIRKMALMRDEVKLLLFPLLTKPHFDVKGNVMPKRLCGRNRKMT